MKNRLSFQVEIEDESHVYFSLDRDSNMFFINWNELSEVDKVKLSVINQTLQRVSARLHAIVSKRTAPEGVEL